MSLVEWQLAELSCGIKRVRPLRDKRLDIVWRPHQCQPSFHITLVLTDSLSQAADAITTLIDERLEGGSFLDWVQIAALDILG